jgi:hypothetical protein
VSKSAEKWTVVQHSAMAAKGDATFARGLESRQVTTAADRTRVERAGGLLFDNYGAAEDFCDDAMYPNPGYKGLVPQAAGTFSNLTVDGAKIYIPVRKVLG